MPPVKAPTLPHHTTSHPIKHYGVLIEGGCGVVIEGGVVWLVGPSGAEAAGGVRAHEEPGAGARGPAQGGEEHVPHHIRPQPVRNQRENNIAASITSLLAWKPRSW